MKRVPIVWLSAVLMFALAGGSTQAADPPAKAAIKGLVTYGGPAANIAVSIEGPVSRNTKTNERGEFTFKDVPPGDYKVECKGIAKNNQRKASTSITVPEPPAELAQMTIKLE